MKVAWFRLAVLLVGISLLSAPAYAKKKKNKQTQEPQKVVEPSHLDAIEMGEVLAQTWHNIIKKYEDSVVRVNIPAPKGFPTTIASAFLIRRDENHGYFLTNYHAVKGQEKVTIHSFEEEEDEEGLETTAIYRHEMSDLAVLVVDAEPVEDFEVFAWANSEAMPLGTYVTAIGTPMGLDNTKTWGHISNKHRELRIKYLEDYVQTDASINPGNSGGPLINLRGEVVGVIFSNKSGPSGKFKGAAFGIASRMAKFVSDQLIDNEDHKVKQGYFGVHPKTASREQRSQFGIESGIVVQKLSSDTCTAAKAGIKPGDCIYSWKDGTGEYPIESDMHFCTLCYTTSPGITICLKVKRGNETITIEDIEAGSMPTPDDDSEE